jgi:hypothetical protein
MFFPWLQYYICVITIQTIYVWLQYKPTILIAHDGSAPWTTVATTRRCCHHSLYHYSCNCHHQSTMEPPICAGAMEMPNLAAAGSRHREPTLALAGLEIWYCKRIDEVVWSAATAVWLPRSARLAMARWSVARRRDLGGRGGSGGGSWEVDDGETLVPAVRCLCRRWWHALASANCGSGTITGEGRCMDWI